MKFRALAVAALAFLPLPATAQEMPLVDHVANMFLGLQAGYHEGNDDRVPIVQVAPGVFEVASSRPVKTVITELEPCVFNYEATIGTRKPRSFQLYMRKLNGVAYYPRQAEANGMATIVVVTDAAGDYIIYDGKPIDAERFVPALETDIPVASLEASVAALKAACPTGDPNEGLELVDHLATAIFGFRHGYEFSLAGSYPVIRTSPGVYEIDMRADYKLSVSEVGNCLFEYTQQSGILMLPKMRVDATKLTSLAFSPTKTNRQQTTYAVTAVVEPGFKTEVNADGTTTPDDKLFATVETSVPLEQLEASVAALLAACPSGDSDGDVALVDHVASVALGLQDGYHVPVAGAEASMRRTGSGVFEIVMPDGRVSVTLSVSEIGKCIFLLGQKTPGGRGPSARIDATKLTSVSYKTARAGDGMAKYTVDAVFEPGFKVIVNLDGTTRLDDELFKTLETDAPITLLEGSVAALLAACP